MDRFLGVVTKSTGGIDDVISILACIELGRAVSWQHSACAQDRLAIGEDSPTNPRSIDKPFWLQPRCSSSVHSSQQRTKPHSKTKTMNSLSALPLLSTLALGDLSPAPSALAAKAKRCFANCDELKDAVDSYIGECDGEGCKVGDTYGWPMNSLYVSEVTNMAILFLFKGSFNEDLSGWDVGKVTDMGQMFQFAWFLNGDVSEWDVRKVTNMGEMFDNARAFNGNLSTWDVGSVTDMGWMFNRASAFNGNLSAWNVGKVTEMGYMFASASALNGNLSAWDVGRVTNKGEDVQYCYCFQRRRIGVGHQESD